MANDTSDFLNASAFRIAYIPKLVSKVKLIDYILTLFILLLGLLICAIVIRRYIATSRVQIGVMQANGVPRKKIAMSLTPFALMPALIGGIAGYLIGFFLQAAAISLFANYWMLPTTLLSFSWLSLVLSIFVPFIIFLGICITSCF
ncbi:hypothetical protein FACS1894166_01650 [Bacilli bacterium]|nr:hypothetical protein FACS1894166_01650 [Bacilli bacterium]